MKIDDIEEVKKFLQENKEFYSYIDCRKAELEKSLSMKELETIDLLHEIELASLNAIDQMRIFKQLKKTREERRMIKDKLELVNTLKGFTTKFITKGICAELNTVIENVNRYEKNLETRSYTPKVLKNLKCGNKKGE